MDKENFISVVNYLKLKDGKFFPFPIYLILNKKFNKNLEFPKEVELIYKKIRVCNFIIKKTYNFNNKEINKIGIKLYKTNSLNHPGYLFFKKEKGTYVAGEIKNFNKTILKEINFSTPKMIKNKLIKLKKIVGFHTRNVPHKGHEWIHNLGIKKCNNILTQPIVGHFKKGEYSEQAVIDANKHLVRKQNLFNLKNKILKKYYFSFINIFPKYAGPKEALLHALIRKNYGCTHFLVGRDHAGFKKFYNEYDSQRLCIKFQKKLKIKIIKFKSPKICKYCKKVKNKKCDCKKSKNKYSLIDINGSTIRKLIANRKTVPDYLIDNDILQNIKVKNILHG